jgi:hypothetical protein
MAREFRCAARTEELDIRNDGGHVETTSSERDEGEGAEYL